MSDAATAVSVAPSVVSVASVDVVSLYRDMTTALYQMSKQIKQLSVQLSKLGKEHVKLAREGGKKGGKKSKAPVDPNRPKRAPSGFAKPSAISAELADFLGEAHDVEIARTNVTKRIHTYIKENSLQVV